jgi:hypothetical protein
MKFSFTHKAVKISVTFCGREKRNGDKEEVHIQVLVHSLRWIVVPVSQP